MSTVRTPSQSKYWSSHPPHPTFPHPSHVTHLPFSMASTCFIFSPPNPKLNPPGFDLHSPFPYSPNSLSLRRRKWETVSFRLTYNRKSRRDLQPAAATPAPMLPENPVVADVFATAFTGLVALSSLRVWEETAKRRLFDQKLNRKLVHISIGLVFMLCWPLFSSAYRGAILAALIPGVNVIRMLLLGLGILKDEATMKSMSRHGDYRELLKGPLYYAATITFACVVYWRTSPVAVAAICNLCAGDGFADVVGRRFGSIKLPYNKNKSVVGSIAMATAGFLASLAFMYYFSYFGYIQESRKMVLGFLIVSLTAALVESLPVSAKLDDNLTVPLTSMLVASLVF